MSGPIEAHPRVIENQDGSGWCLRGTRRGDRSSFNTSFCRPAVHRHFIPFFFHLVAQLTRLPGTFLPVSFFLLIARDLVFPLRGALFLSTASLRSPRERNLATDFGQNLFFWRPLILPPYPPVLTDHDIIHNILSSNILSVAEGEKIGQRFRS